MEKTKFCLKEKTQHSVTFHSPVTNYSITVYVLEDDLFRVYLREKELLSKTWMVAPGMEDVPYEGREKTDFSPFSLPTYHITEEDHSCSIETEKIKVTIDLTKLVLFWYYKKDDKWILIANDRKTQSYNMDSRLGEGIYHYMERHPDEQYFGLGEKAGNVNKYGKRFRMVSYDAMGYDAEFTDPLYKHVPYYLTRNVNTNISYGIFYDSMSSSVFDMGLELDNYHGHYRYFQSDEGDLDYYFFVGPTIEKVVKRVSWLTGKTILPPKWSLGYSGSTMSYTDAPNAQDKLEEFMERTEKEDILCDSFQLSSGYTSIGDKRYVFNWNTQKVPDPQGLMENFHKHGIKVCANIKPCLLIDHPAYQELHARSMFIQNGAGGSEVSQFWDDLGSYLDFSNQETFTWWKDRVKDSLLKYGIDSTWNDNNEFEVWNKEAVCHGFGTKAPFERFRALQPLLMMKASYEAQKEYDPESRPFLISRSGCSGMQRYVQTWSGDNYTSWKTIKFNIKMGISLSLSGIYNFGHDVGGFSGPSPEPELLIRWVQNGIFHPRFTIHSWNDDETVNEPWMYPEYTTIIRELIKFRHALTPYFYTALYLAHAEYDPIIKPTFYQFENDKQTFEECDDFMVGEWLLVPSVVKKGEKLRNVYLPEHSYGWYDFHTGKHYNGGQTITLNAPLEQPPLLVKAGGMIPLNKAEVTAAAKEKDQREIRLFPPKGQGEAVSMLYEDDGISNQSNSLIFTFKMICTTEMIELEVIQEGSYQPSYSEMTFVLPKDEARQVTINGKPAKTLTI
ncbi:glycoside hydrolase family 31 protein [Metabacillus arenae]|uniref:Glycoside hydrolase family 31 protein n=1 Tax=Metabacillus arenae TaxID=2771434 RepID=A0A926NRA0_9BACI|nr:glycoside hydrolase family 31 protein [Metabacillus arenae]MBD1382542.1 glycoside hydrolase family 31 protein [Metabacillus arenae]